MGTLIQYGNITYPVVDVFVKADSATAGGFSVFIWMIVFALVFMALYKKYNNIEKPLAIAGFVTAILNVSFVVIAHLPWNYIWISVACLIIGFVAKAFEEN